MHRPGRALPETSNPCQRLLPKASRHFQALPGVSGHCQTLPRKRLCVSRYACRAMAIAVLDAKQRRSHGGVSPESAPGRRVFCGRGAFFYGSAALGAMGCPRMGCPLAHGPVVWPECLLCLCHPLCPSGRLGRFLVLGVSLCCVANGRPLEALGCHLMGCHLMGCHLRPSQAIAWALACAIAEGGVPFGRCHPVGDSGGGQMPKGTLVPMLQTIWMGWRLVYHDLCRCAVGLHRSAWIYGY